MTKAQWIHHNNICVAQGNTIGWLIVKPSLLCISKWLTGVIFMVSIYMMKQKPHLMEWETWSYMHGISPVFGGSIGTSFWNTFISIPHFNCNNTSVFRQRLYAKLWSATYSTITQNTMNQKEKKFTKIGLTWKRPIDPEKIILGATFFLCRHIWKHNFISLRCIHVVFLLLFLWKIQIPTENLNDICHNNWDVSKKLAT